ncbi:hypothetical protein DFH08DRAFT_150662 [Mycena albidolilacea]|uniref:Uncharacterized protein n=1 Tax=Mycena albidolilacea TaxID=1033008 RepID=A0AAD7A357_9AGAR|nr:hypothetical protein DFH08DRAFT_150662 [Mycena albidolilacea]
MLPIARRTAYPDSRQSTPSTKKCIGSYWRLPTRFHTSISTFAPRGCTFRDPAKNSGFDLAHEQRPIPTWSLPLVISQTRQRLKIGSQTKQALRFAATKWWSCLQDQGSCFSNRAEHAVISSNTGSDGRSDFARTATWTVGRYFFCASSIRPAMSVTLHMVMVQHLLTNADHFPMWPIFIRVNMFWLNVTSECPKAELDSLAAYCPDLGDAHGWIDIIDLSLHGSSFPCSRPATIWRHRHSRR